ncbi:uncharacterized protein A1O9_12721 [Exophiala aquamarina CBS 119918]|uniref:Uncharacterized protein n=1 Tax=Exophiala aquamarina CBS 119918 TaxID=1182545 RepID=A0A072NW15_9EURO|nr:uncharacterized protein A1O9_12721 [Exophiala aquamarina CBS 119918]KEF51218.1 hypothetical protein A1O9_12721 [Exophiala aquamarina CBS 119918]
MSANQENKVIRVGVIGCGELMQVVHLPVLTVLTDYFRITALCDVSQNVLQYCSRLIKPTPKLTTSAMEICSSPDVDGVIICSNSALHTIHMTLALQNNKHVCVEKPVTYNFRDIAILTEAEQKSKCSIFVAYMRRYAPAFLSALEEVGDRSQIQYARIRAIMGQNSDYVKQSGMFPKRFNDISPAVRKELLEKDIDMKDQALAEFGVPVNDQTRTILFWLGALGTHDLSAMRESLGLPRAVAGAHLKPPIWSAILEYDGFSVTYESGMNSVPDFDTHIEIYTKDKIVQVKYEQPYIKGLPTMMKVRERITGRNGQTAYQERIVRETYEDNYTLELKAWYNSITEDKRPKTTLEDAAEDLKIFKMLMQAAFCKS